MDKTHGPSVNYVTAHFVCHAIQGAHEHLVYIDTMRNMHITGNANAILPIA